MNTPEFRLLAIWQMAVELKNVQQKMLAYEKIASQVGINERNVRENIKKLVELGYLVAKDNWYAMNFDCEFIQFVLEKQPHEEEPEIRFMIVPTAIVPKEETTPVLTEPATEYKPKAFVSDYTITYPRKTVDKFVQDFGEDNARSALLFFKEKVVENSLSLDA